MQKAKTLLEIAAILMLSGDTIAQVTQIDPRPEFEVASIKLSAPSTFQTTIDGSPGGRLNIRNMNLKELIAIAWSIQPFQISGGPGWLESAHFDISAKSEAGHEQSDVRAMLQALLTDRFQLRFHHETKELPIYALVVNKDDGKLRPGLTESEEGACGSGSSSQSVAESHRVLNLECGEIAAYPGQIRAIKVPLDTLTFWLTRLLTHTVAEKTGLTGNFDIVLKWTPDEGQIMQWPLLGAPNIAPSEGTGPSIFAAIKEQLGLKLESQKGPVNILLIDRAEKPSEN